MPGGLASERSVVVVVEIVAGPALFQGGQAGSSFWVAAVICPRSFSVPPPIVSSPEGYGLLHRPLRKMKMTDGSSQSLTTLVVVSGKFGNRCKVMSRTGDDR